METEALLSSFNGHVDQYAQHREYVRRAEAMAPRFSRDVIEKVVLDHEIKASAVAEDVLPLVPSIEERVDAIDAEKADIEEGKASSDAQMEELTLRQAIGELSDEDFEAQTGSLRETLESANARLDELNGERTLLTEALGRWVELAAEGKQADGTRAPEPEEEEEVVVEDEVVVDDEPAAVEEAGAVEEDVVIEEEVVVEDDVVVEDEVVADEPVVAEDDGQHASVAPIKEDMSAVFESATGDAPAAVEADAADAIEVEDDEGVDFGFEVDDGGEVELNLEAGTGDDMGDEIGIDLEVGLEGDDDEGDDEPVVEEERRAILLYQEGTAEEQIYPFQGDVLSIGRGRDNDIQIKNDSKVSRFHCRLFRRGGNFYIEDNKSSNGTLVNGELITERRLFGGEEIIIGETFFRFRIM